MGSCKSDNQIKSYRFLSKKSAFFHREWMENSEILNHSTFLELSEEEKKSQKILREKVYFPKIFSEKI